jgi:hypothetical protein
VAVKKNLSAGKSRRSVFRHCRLDLVDSGAKTHMGADFAQFDCAAAHPNRAAGGKRHSATRLHRGMGQPSQALTTAITRSSSG